MVAVSTPDRDAVEFLTSLLAAIPAFVTRTDARFTIRYINRTIVGLTEDEVVGRNVFDFIAPEHHEIARACFERVQATNAPSRYEAEAGTADNRAYYVNYVSPVHEADGSTGICIVGMDVTEDRLRQNDLEAGRDKLRMVTDTAGMGLWEWDVVRNEAEWDERMREIMGRAEALDLERYVAECVHPDDRELVRSNAERAFREGAFSGEISRIVRPGGEIVWTMTSARVQYDASGKPVRMLGACVDITRQRLVEEQMRRAQNLQGLGTLTAGIAHNFNNLLMVIQPALEMLGERAAPEDRPLVRDAEDATERAAGLVRQLTAFAGRGAAYRFAPTRLGDVVRQSVQLARQTFGPTIIVRVHESHSPTVRADSGAIEQVLFNAMINARDAVLAADVAEPTVDVYVEQVRRARPDEPGPARSSFAVVRVRDNGIGMSEEVRQQIFEPFYTTKGALGTGLGLSTSYAIVREHEGWLECDSVPGRGTELRLFLATDGPEESAPPRDAAKRARILVIDDEAAIRDVISSLLSREYEVVPVASADEAEERLSHDRDFQLALVDQSMPGASGRSIVPKLRAAIPNALIYYFTGIMVDTPGEVDGVIQKPVSGKKLRARIASALSGLGERS